MVSARMMFFQILIWPAAVSPTAGSVIRWSRAALSSHVGWAAPAAQDVGDSVSIRPGTTCTELAQRWEAVLPLLTGSTVHGAALRWLSSLCGPACLLLFDLWLRPQELAGYTGGDVNFIKEDFELQLNKQLVLDSVSV